jgi:hypothetical protein
MPTAFALRPGPRTRLSARRSAILGLTLLAAASSAAAGEDGYTFGGDQTWAFQYPANGLRDGALLDLRSLNETVAGEKGVVTISPDGDFRDGAGRPLRFWAINAKFDFEKPEDFDTSARFLAKMGVNLARLHADLAPKDGKAPLDQPDAKEIDRIWREVAALKKQGIYAAISPFWRMKPSAAQGIDGYTGDADAWGVHYFNPKLRAAYKAWVTKLYGDKNPYTGMRLADDPAVAVIQTQNEDSLFFWTFQGMKAPQKKLLASQFAAWAVKKYGALDKAVAAWGGEKAEGDDIAKGEIGLLMTWAINQAPAGKANRAADQVEFMARTQHDYYQDIHDHYRSLGCKQLINASNWQTADAIRLGDVERWTYTADEVIAVNKYYGGKHDGENNGWRIDPGHTFTNETGVRDLKGLPTNLKQIAGKPMMITESSWVNPNLYQSEGPFLMAAYQSLSGIDCYFWFAQTTPEYDDNFAIGFPFLNIQNQHPPFKWSCSIPALMGAFPANALAFRKGYIAKGKPAVHEARSLTSMFRREYPIIAEAAEFDPNRREGGEAQAQAEKAHLTGGVDPLAFFVGPVEATYDADAGKTTVADLGKYIDTAKKTVTSNTGEIVMDYGRNVCVVDAPKSKGVCGFLKEAGGTFTLTDATVASGNRYAAINLVAMDDQPLKSSKQVLLQVDTIARATGWEAKDLGGGKMQVVNVGKKPWQVVKADVTITLANPGLAKAVALDAAGFATAATVAIRREGAILTVTMPADALYVLLTP